ncbi:ABC transporter ATP-binding protein [Salipiger aestuarii]|uniref:ABC transporter ATP-binding protein n=1 Tax=Salipiger aestuarii TaxID=568098 RepID=UPI00123ADF1D|nr:ABC transporter ATP-binding protein [Salipiger aestuarii]KAA8615123.1 peptide ABC transporter ATP-binding protein [Salipiger aestuarii]
MTALMRATGLRKSYATGRAGLFRPSARFNAVDGVTLHIKPGETLGVVGESGCGKSTLSRLVLGLAQADAGEILFDGAPLPRADTDDWRRMRIRMQLVHQNAAGALDPRLPVRAQVEEALRIHKRAPERAARALSDVGLPPAMAARYPHEMSGGQLQRVVIARALALDPDLLVLDEPVSALDVSIQAQIVNLIRDLQAARGLAYLFVSHDVAVVRHVADRIAVMYLGRVVEEGPTAAFRTGALHPYTRALLDAVPVPDPGCRGGAVPRIGDPPNPAAPPPGCRFHPRCPFAVHRCRAEPPVLREFAARHHAACHRIEEIA